MVEKGWVNVGQLRKNDVLCLSNGEHAMINKVFVEQLEVTEATYNFEVQDFHMYYVTESNVLVHNVCKDVGVYDITTAKGRHYIGRGSSGRMQRSIRRVNRMAKKHGDEVFSSVFYKTGNNKWACIKEAKFMDYYAKDGVQLYNKIASSGAMVILLEED